MNLMNNLAERFGLNAYALGKYELAETWFRRLEKTEGESNRVLRNLGVILMARGNLAGAAEYLRREEELYGENLQRHRALADLHYASLDREEAQRRYAAAIDERDTADLPDSERNFMKARVAICADPARFAHSRESADCFAAAERSREADGDAALELFIKAGELDPTNWPAFNNAGVLLLAKADGTERALEMFTRAAECVHLPTIETNLESARAALCAARKAEKGPSGRHA